MIGAVALMLQVMATPSSAEPSQASSSAVFNGSPLEPTTQQAFDAMAAHYLATPFSVSIADGHMSCQPAERIESAILSVQTCLAASNCAEKGTTSTDALSACANRSRKSLLKAYRKEWRKAHSS